MKNKDEGRLTAQEYEAIYLTLNEYVRLVNKNKIPEPFYVSDVRKKKLPQIHRILNKMNKRMKSYNMAWV